MVDVSAKNRTAREAEASAFVTPGSFGPRNHGFGRNTTSSAALLAAKTSRVPP